MMWSRRGRIRLDAVGIVLIAHEEAIADDKVRMTFRVVLPRPVAEALAARAIWEGKKIGTQVTEILEAADYHNRT